MTSYFYRLTFFFFAYLFFISFSNQTEICDLFFVEMPVTNTEFNEVFKKNERLILMHYKVKSYFHLLCIYFVHRKKKLMWQSIEIVLTEKYPFKLKIKMKLHVNRFWVFDSSEEMNWKNHNLYSKYVFLVLKQFWAYLRWTTSIKTVISVDCIRQLIIGKWQLLKTLNFTKNLKISSSNDQFDRIPIKSSQNYEEELVHVLKVLKIIGHWRRLNNFAHQLNL